jgi:hypothetical protein
MLSSHFVGLRKQVQQVEQDNDERSSIPITIRFGHFFSFPYSFVDATLVVNWRPLSAFLSRLPK